MRSMNLNKIYNDAILSNSYIGYKLTCYFLQQNVITEK